MGLERRFPARRPAGAIPSASLTTTLVYLCPTTASLQGGAAHGERAPHI